MPTKTASREAAPETPTPPPETPLTLTVTVGPKNAYTDPKSGLRFYRWGDRDLPSVTSIRRMAGIPHGLHQWSVTKVIDAALDRSTEIVSRLAGADPGAVAVLRSELRGAATAERDAAAQLGTAVHDAAATGKALTEVDAALRPRLRQYLDWLRVSGATVLAAEFQTWNLTVGYAGTADLLCRFPDGSIWLVDLKTGKGVYGEHALQLMAYLMAEFVGEDGVRNDAVTDLLHQARGMAILHLADRSWEFLAVRGDPGTWAAFRGLLAFGEWVHSHGPVESFTAGVRRSGDGAAA